AAATLPDGRQDESIGGVSLEGLKGESRSNAMMKAETKAKRRGTLSIFGLGVPDEKERDLLGGTPSVDAGRPKPWTTFRGMLDAFADLKSQLGSGRHGEYYAVLARYGMKHANEFRDPAQAAEAYFTIAEALGNFPPAQPESTTVAQSADRPT